MTYSLPTSGCSSIWVSCRDRALLSGFIGRALGKAKTQEGRPRRKQPLFLGSALTPTKVISADRETLQREFLRSCRQLAGTAAYYSPDARTVSNTFERSSPGLLQIGSSVQADF